MDARRIARVHVETWRSAYPGLVPDAYLIGLSERQRAASWRESIGRGGQATHLVAEVAGAGIVGFGDCGASRTRELPYAGEIYSLYVQPDWQDQGIGRQLLGGLFDELAASGRRSCFLWVLSGNPSRFFYEAMGGQAVGERREQFAGAWLPETAYAWPDLIAWLRAARS